MFALLLLSLFGLAAPQAPVPVPAARQELLIANRSDVARHEIVRAPVPLSKGQVRDASQLEVGGQLVPALPLLRWPDGSIALMQVHVPVELAPGEESRLAVRTADPEAPAAEFEGRWHLEGPLPFVAEVRDPWGQIYTASFELQAPEQELSSPLVRVRRYRGVATREQSEFLGVVAWLTTFRGERRAELTVLLDNGAHLAPSAPLGPVRLQSFAMVTRDSEVKFRPRFAYENVLRVAEKTQDGGYRQYLLGASDQIYLGDRTAKAFRLDVFLDGEEVDDDQRLQARLASSAPLLAWPDPDWVRSTGAFGAHGGPAPAGIHEEQAELARWRKSARFGPFGGHGDAEDASAQGTPRNGPSALHNVVRWQSASLLRAAETQVLQHCLRPTPGCDLREPEEMAEFRLGLAERARNRPHGFTALDYEHFSVDLIYDYYWLTGDPLALAELRRMGSGLLSVLKGVPFRTSRGEGWCLQAGVLVARATRDAGLLGALREHAREFVAPEIGEPPMPAAIPQPPHPDAFGPSDRFDAPWQMAALVHGLSALSRETADLDLAAAAVRTGRIMAGPGWIEGIGPKYLVSASRVDRYTMPVGHGPMEGTAVMEVGAFVLAAEMSEELRDRVLFARRAHAIVVANRAAETAVSDGSRWLQLYLDRREREAR